MAGFALHDARLAAVVGDRTGPRESPRDGPGAHARVGMVPCTPSIRGPPGRVSNLTLVANVVPAVPIPCHAIPILAVS